MTIESIAAKYRLRTKKEDDEVIIPCKLGQIYVYDDETLGALFMPDTPQKGWTQRRDKMVGAGAIVSLNGDTEGSVIFPANSAALIKLAAKLFGAYRKRTLSPETKAKLSARLAKARSKVKKTHKKGS